jgi:hypothetical protein
MPPEVLAVQLNLLSFGIVAILLTVLLIVAGALQRLPTRPCHRCGRRVPISARVCRYCGYEFAPVRMSR